MGKSLIINRIGGKNKFVTVPCDMATASTFASTFLEGEYQVFGDPILFGTDTVTVAPDVVNVMFKNKATQDKSYMTLYVKATLDDDSFFASIMGMTLNGVLIDEAFILSRKTSERF